MTERVDVAVIGGGLAGWVAALECAKFGLNVRICVDPDAQSAILSGTLGGVTDLDFACESFSPGDAVDQLANELGVATEVLLPRHTALDNGAVTAPVPRQMVAGIPANPFAKDVSVFTRGGRLRAYADRVMPVLEVGQFERLGPLVSRRYGSRMLEQLVGPMTLALFGVDATQVSLDRVAPRLNARLTSYGSLSGAVLSLVNDSETQLRFVHGASSLLDAIRKRAADYAVSVLSARVDVLSQTDDGWLVTCGDNALNARFVIVAVDPAELGYARKTGVDRTLRRVRVAHVLAEVRGKPTFTGLLRAQAGDLISAARPVSRSAALAGQCAPGTDVIRLVSAPDSDIEPGSLLERAAAGLGFDDVVEIERHEADWTLIRPWVGVDDPTGSDPHPLDCETAAWTGQWSAGSGAARVVAHAQTAAARIRRNAITTRGTENP